MTRSDVPLVVCPECGSENNSFANACWICRNPLYPGKEELVEAELVPQAAVRRSGQVEFGMALTAFVLLVLGTVLLTFGLLASSFDGIIPFLLIVLPLVVAVSAFMLRGSRSENSVLRNVSFALSAVVVTMGTVVLLGIASVIALFAFCVMLISMN